VRALADALGVSNEVRAALMDSASRREPGDGHLANGQAEAGAVERGRPVVLDAGQESAAWEIYVELVTRVATVELGAEQGMLREALTSLYSLFATMRTILREHGPAVARTHGPEASVVSAVAMAILNDVLRPLLSKWHPLLLDHESRRPDGRSAAEHERAWARNEEMRRELARARERLAGCAQVLAAAAAVPHPLVTNQARLGAAPAGRARPPADSA